MWLRAPARGQDPGELAVGGGWLRGEVDRIDAQHGIGRPSAQPGRGEVADKVSRRGAQPPCQLAGLAHRFGGEVDPHQPGTVRTAISSP